MERIFKNALKKELARRIKGKIYVHINGDTIIVDITDNGFNYWHYTVNNLAVQLSSGLSSRVVADLITKQYKKYVFDTHFR